MVEVSKQTLTFPSQTPFFSIVKGCRVLVTKKEATIVHTSITFVYIYVLRNAITVACAHCDASCEALCSMQTLRVTCK